MPQNGGGKGWVTNPDTNEQVMPDLWRGFLEWLLLGPERVPQTQKEWAVENGVHQDSLRRWKRDHVFRFAEHFLDGVRDPPDFNSAKRWVSNSVELDRSGKI